MAGILARPFGIAEWIWACGAALALVVFGLVAPGAAAAGIARGSDVYLFLSGMMLLAEIARRAGVFTWLASLAAVASRGSSRRLFFLVYGVGTLVTIVLSNDATAIVLTPAVATVARHAKVRPLPYVFACAFVANAASFVLPISNPANLIVFAGTIPPLGTWLRAFALPSLAAIVVTLLALFALSRCDLRDEMEPQTTRERLALPGVVACAGIGCSAIALLVTSMLGGPIGTVTASAALLVLVAFLCVKRDDVWPALRSVSWSILPLVAGLFVLVAGLETAGSIDALRGVLDALARRPPGVAIASIAVGSAFVSNLTNNLPLGVIAGEALSHGTLAEGARYAATIGIDLGPNLSVTGSLATILWLVALRRERIPMNGWRFFRMGLVVMPAALAAAVGSLVPMVR